MALGQSQTRLALDFRTLGAPWTRLPWTLGPWAALGLPGRKRDAGANFVPQRIPLNKQLAKGRSEVHELDQDLDCLSHLTAKELFTGFLTHA